MKEVYIYRLTETGIKMAIVSKDKIKNNFTASDFGRVLEDDGEFFIVLPEDNSLKAESIFYDYLNKIIDQEEISYKGEVESIENIEATHLCPSLMKMEKVSIIKTLQAGLSGWYYIDDNVIIENSDGAGYGSAIRYCPFCGEKLSKEKKEYVF